MADENRNDLVLNPNEYAYVLDTTKGNVSVYVGPNKTSLSNSDKLVRFNKDSKRFENCDYKNSISLFTIIPEGFYALLKNPEESNKHPQVGSVTSTPDTLKIGEKINIKGPCSFALYPGQMAQTIQGHTLRSNQYLLVRVYDAEAANKNKNFAEDEKPYVTGNLMIIKGTDCSFYIPETGFEVIPVEHHCYVRDAITLERLEYCILKDEDGNKRYVHGPAVVFPNPTETFVKQNGSIKYKAIELSEISGVYVKVIADYKEDNVEYHVGEELFITGKEQMIYYPRTEHALISYEGNNVYHAIAIPNGEGRYVMNRKTGVIKTVIGPQMFLPDPRNEVIVNRKLSKTECEQWYPGNQDVLAYNVGVEPIIVTDGLSDAINTAYTTLSASCCNTDAAIKSITNELSTFDRKNKYTKPRSITFDNKYDGVVSIDVWTGYAVDVISKNGNHEVVCGPKTIVLDYDQVLGSVYIPSGTNSKNYSINPSAFLKYRNNQFNDIITVETNDFVKACISVSYTVDFDEAHKDRWFAVDNYIHFLCSKLKSDVARGVKKYSINEFYHNYSDIVSSLIFGESVTRFFEENGMTLSNVDVMSIDIDKDVQNMLENTQRTTIKNMLAVQRAKDDADRELQEIQMNLEIERTRHNAELEAMEANRIKTVKEQEMQDAASRFNESQQKAVLEFEKEKDKIHSIIFASQLKRAKDQETQRLDLEEREIKQQSDKNASYAKTVAEVMEAVAPEFIAAMQSNCNAEMLRSVSEAMAPLAIAKGESVADTVNTLMRGTSLEGFISKAIEATHK